MSGTKVGLAEGDSPVADAAAAAGEWYEDGCADDDAGGQKGNSTTFGEDGEKETTTLAKRRRWAKMANEAAQASRYLYCLVDKATGDSRVQQRCAGTGYRWYRPKPACRPPAWGCPAAVLHQ